ncbi:Gfo/Idh/MocA family oxidoreductase [Rheinheimera sp. 1928-s]|uniref:Gfo/Idh/MocA family oxidoreductase n=1 Tax=Rheinheimera sp. 1928-s TaxID=3033803 RepID=UPI0026301FF6|nr:Gfo/Idh/MocA family oxidoreductase [Rheinheimera sp. 1928-s]MDF3125830.1 Gfo/Idh/MocA family oxidoreductase [Rheinheimera sp. 1928-s]
MSLMHCSLVLVGAGELGSRHLQSMASLPDCSIDVVEPDVLSVEKAKQRLAQVQVNAAQIRFFQSIEQLSSQYDLALIATGAAVRFELSQELLRCAKVRYLVLEKVLFQRPEHYALMQNLLEQYEVQAYVNCPRRCYPLYRQLSLITAKTPVLMKVQGNLWGMACNSIHFIDLVSFLSSESLLSVDHSQLVQSLQSKRVGYLEVAGTLRCVFSQGSELLLHCTADERAPTSVLIECSSAKVCFDIDEVKGSVHRRGERELILRDMPMLYQSQLTAGVVDDLLRSGSCSLTPFAESAALHLPLIHSLLAYFRQESVELNHCPIT